MKPRKWIVVFGFFLVLCGFAVYQGVRTLEKNRNVEKILIEKISPLLGGAFEIEKARLGFFSAYLSNVSASIPLHAFRIHVKDIKVAISLRRLIETRGDFGRSISKLIFVSPEIEFTGAPANGGVAGGGARQPLGRGFPVEHVLINDGVFRIHLPESADPVVLGEKLDGKIREQRRGVSFELKGSLASRRRNLSITGMVSRPGQPHRLSLRLSRARIRKPLRAGKLSVSAGMLDGVCELRFTDSVTMHTVESSGWVTVENGKAHINGVEEPFHDFNVQASFANSRIHFDSISVIWDRLHAAGGGVWDLAGADESAIRLRTENQPIEALAGSLPESVSRHILGNGWAEAEIRKPPQGRGAPRIIARLGGFSAWGKPVTRCEGFGRFDRGTLRLDSLAIAAQSLSFLSRGTVEFSQAPVAYSFDGTGVCRAQDLVESASGPLKMTYSLDGSGADIAFMAAIVSDSLAWREVALGPQRITVTNRGDGILFSNADAADQPVSFSGSVDRMFAERPYLSADLRIGAGPILQILDRIPSRPAGALDSVSAYASIVGHLPSFEANGRIAIEAKRLSGAVKARVRRDSTDVMHWELSGPNVRINNAGVSLAARGVSCTDSVLIDSFALAERITGDGAVYFQSDAWRWACRIAAAGFPLTRIDTVLGGGGRIDGGYLDGTIRVNGSMKTLSANGRLRVRNARVGGIGGLETDMVVAADSRSVRVRPFVIRKEKQIILAVDTLEIGDHLVADGSFSNLDLGGFLHGVLADDIDIAGAASGSFTSADSGYVLYGSAQAPRIAVNGYGVDSAHISFSLDASGATVHGFKARDSARTAVEGSGYVSWAFVSGDDEGDTLEAALSVRGDLLATLARHFDSPIGGTGRGSISLAFGVNAESWDVSEAYASIPSGRLTVYPFVLDEVTDFSFQANLDDSARLHTRAAGRIRKRPITVTSNHAVPEGYEALRIGPVNCGVLLVSTPKNGVDIHMPGFMPEGARADIAFGGRAPFEQFAISGPLEKIRLTGTWTIRDVEFTFPLLEEEVLPWPFDPFPYIDWEMDIIVGNRRVSYFYDVGVRKRLLRFVECRLEPGGAIKLRGREIDKTFRLYGGLRSYRGAAFFGKVFDRNMEVGCDFSPRPLSNGGGYDNLPIVWGSAEAFSDSSRFDRIRLTLLTKDTTTGALSEKGRFNEISIRISSNFEEIPGEAEREFYRRAGLRFVTLEGAGGFVSDIGEQYLHRYFLQRWERKLARRIGLDVISFETSIASNYFYYFYNNRFSDLASQWDNLALANVGVTLGRYFLSDRVFLKWRTELVPSDTLIHPEHSLGFELYPVRNLLFDVSSGFYRGEDAYQWNPKVSMQLRLPITRLRKALDF